MATDGSGPLTIDFFNKMEGCSSFDPRNVLMIMDHYVPCPNDKVAGLHTMMRDFAKQGFGTVLDLGEGICHQLLPEKGYVRPGRLIVGGDSHSTTYGAFNALGTGGVLGSLPPHHRRGAVVCLTIGIRFSGALPPSVSAKDLALWIVGHIGAEGGRYKAIEFTGRTFGPGMSQRMTLCNLMVETGAKFAVMPGDGKTAEWFQRLHVPG